MHKKSHKKPNSYTKAEKKNKTDQKTSRKKAKDRYLFWTCTFKIIDISVHGNDLFSLEWTGKYELQKYKFKCRYYHCSCNRELSLKKMQGFDGIREHNVGVRTAVLNLLSYEDLYRPIFWVYCSSVLLFLVNAVESSEEELDNVSIWRRVFSSKLLKTQIKEKNTLVKTEL